MAEKGVCLPESIIGTGCLVRAMRSKQPATLVPRSSSVKKSKVIAIGLLATVFALSSLSMCSAQEEAIDIRLTKDYNVFLGGPHGCHHLKGATGSHRYVSNGVVWSFDLVRDKEETYWVYYHEKGFPNYKWKFRRYTDSSNYLPIYRQFPEDGNQWRYFQSAFLTVLSQKEPFGDPKTREKQ
jgi:hypothetical protein